MKGYQLSATGYWGKNSVLNRDGKITLEIVFEHLEDAENKKKQFEHWAEICEIPPYELSITEVE